MFRMSTCGACFIGIATAFWTNCALAQIVPDGTLPNNSIININGNTFNITGGTQAGGNLFHSFKDFSVPTGSEAFFNNTVDIKNIISRVTGGSISNIDGLIRSLGTANLFLINPNGIVFGPNASLNVGGSFVASTASAIQFGNQGIFSATNPEASAPLLTINPDALLFNQIRAASIANNSVAPSGLNPSSALTATGLRVPDGKSLLLVGGDINMNGGGLYAFGGRVELGGLASAGTVGLNGDGNNLSLSFPNSVERSDIFLSNGARVTVTASDGGSIAVNARNLEMTAESVLSAGIERGLGSDNSKAGNISVNATGAINLNNKSQINNGVLSEARGQGGDVSISARTLRLESGAQVSGSTRGAGKGGNLSVDAQDVQLIGTSADGQAASSLGASAQPNSTGDAGNVTIKTNTLLVRDGARVSTVTSGAGKGGNLSVDAQDVQLIGRTADIQSATGLGASAQPNSTGDAGNVTIKTNTLLVRNGAQVGAFTSGAGKGGSLSVDAQDVQLIGTSADPRFPSGLAASAELNSTGDAGSLTVKTNTLLVRDGAQVSTATFSVGNAGNLSVDAQDVQLIGRTANNLRPSALATSAQRNSTGDAGNLTLKTNTLLVRDGAEVSADTFGAGKGGSLSVDAQNVQLIGRSANGQFPSALGASAKLNSTGDAGDLTIKTNTLLVRDSAAVNVESSGTGTAGNMTLNARSIRLDKNALLTANTQSAKVDPNREQATININSQDLIMTGNSNISTDATGENVIGGNINIDSDVLVAIENSDITANSANFRGGKVRINTQGIFRSPDSDITATGGSSELGGSVEINRPDVDQILELVELPTVLADTSQLIADTGCAGVASTDSDTDKSSFTITGRGGLPPSPYEPLSTDVVWLDTRLADITSQQQRSEKPSTKPSSKDNPVKIVPATGWVFDGKGNVTLISHASNANLGSTAACQKK